MSACFILIGCSGGSELSPDQQFVFACGDGDIVVVSDMLEQGLDANGVGDVEGLPLLFALEAGHFEVAELLVENGADVNIQAAGESLVDALINSQANTDDEEEHARFQAAIDWLYDNGARRPPE